jgi:hypothetical protein
MRKKMIHKQIKCFWCDKDIPKIVNDYTPCEKCARIITKGIVLIEVQDIPMQVDQPTLLIEKNYPTGFWYLLRPNNVHKIFNNENAERLLKDRIAFVDTGMMTALGLRLKEEQPANIQ